MKTLTLFKPRYWHSWVGLLLSLALIPILRSEHLPLKFDGITLGVAYWFILSAQSIFAAVLFCLIGMPRKEVLEPLLGRYPKDPLRIVPLLLFSAVVLWITHWLRALALTADAVALLELQSANRERAAPSGARGSHPGCVPVFRIPDGFCLQQRHRVGSL